jgi:hypothetical protein
LDAVDALTVNNRHTAEKDTPKMIFLAVVRAFVNLVSKRVALIKGGETD